METHVTEEQQIAAIKAWLKENGSSIVTGIILGFAMLFGVKAWMAWQENKAQAASDLYAVMISALESGDTRAVGDKAGMLISEYPGSGYAVLAGLALAKVRIEEGELEAARTQLQWVLDNSAADYIRDTARLRLARVLLALEDTDGAMRVIEQGGTGGARAGLYAELRGDIQRARGEYQLAASSYREALETIGEEYPGLLLLKYKLEDSEGRTDTIPVGAPTETAAAPETAAADTAATTRAGDPDAASPGTDSATAGTGDTQ